MTKKQIPKGLPYYGGKNPTLELNKWISKIIGQNTKVLYCEPFAGMLGILLARPKSRLEMVNDSNGWLISWWKAVRDYPNEFGLLIDNTPYSRDLYEEAITQIKSICTGNILQDGLVAHTVITQSLAHGLGARKSSWSVTYADNTSLGKWYDKNIKILHERIKDVQIENKDCLSILEKTSAKNKAIIYCDPPYQNAKTEDYGKFYIDLDKMTELLLAQKGEVFVSGYDNEWDHLEWERYEHKTICRGIGKSNKIGSATSRTEVLWTNASRGLF